jgi:hypothetical protein
MSSGSWIWLPAYYPKSTQKDAAMTKIYRFSRTALKRVLMHPYLAWISAIIVIRNTRFIHRATTTDKIVVLTFDSDRWRQDLTALARYGNLDIHAIDDAAIGRINGWFGSEGSVENIEYFNEKRPAFLTKRKKHAAFATAVMQYVKSWLGIECACTCAIHYVRDFPWMIASQDVGVPFVVIHKEFTVIDTRHASAMKERWEPRNFKFLGSHLCVTNKIAYDLFNNLGVAPENNITRTGLLRSDNLFNKSTRYLNKSPKERTAITLFSFGHTTGPFDLSDNDMRSHYFSKWDHVGFVKLFRDVHVSFAQLAIKNPEVTFNIKPKNVEPWWINEIEDVIVEHLNLSLADIPNCNIVDRPAPELISISNASIVLNSTVVLESRMLGKNTIIPLFAEASGEYADHIYFDEFLDLFAVADSREMFVELIERAIGGEELVANHPERLGALCDKYLGNDDGAVAERVINVFRQEIAKFEGGDWKQKRGELATATFSDSHS